MIAIGVLWAQCFVCIEKIHFISSFRNIVGIIRLFREDNSETAKAYMERSVCDTEKDTNVKIRGQNKADLVFNMA